MNTELNNKPNIKLTVPFFMVANMETSLHFYTTGLGFTIANQWTPRGKIEWCWLQREGVALMLQEPRTDSHNYREPGAKKGQSVSICFQCEDALALYDEFTGRGLKVSEPFVGNNMWVVILEDPDGFKLDFESPTDVPEETKYSEWKK